MTAQVKPTMRESRRLQTRERILGAAIAEFKRSGTAAAEVSAIVTAAGVAHGTFYFHFPTKEHVLLELECREEARMAAGLERRFGRALFKEVLALHLLPSRPERDDWTDPPEIVLLVGEIERALGNGDAHPDADAFYSATFFLLGVYGVFCTTDDVATRDAMLTKLVASALRGLEAR